MVAPIRWLTKASSRGEPQGSLVGGKFYTTYLAKVKKKFEKSFFIFSHLKP